jgi:CRISPR-associated protein Cas1
MSSANLKVLARYTDSLSYLFVEHAVVEREGHSVAAFTADGRITLPAAAMGCLVLGPGTRITHGALGVLAQSGCLVVWAGSDGLKFYAAGQAKSRSSAAIERQARHWADDTLRMGVVRRLYEARFAERLDPTLTLQQIRGREGARVRDIYRHLAERYGVPWQGRRYDPGSWDKADPVNRALSAANASLYAIVLAGIHSLGFSPALGFIHTGKQLSFVYDVADIFKMDTSVPAAFEAAAEGPKGAESRAREYMRRRAAELHLLDRVSSTLQRLFGIDGPGVAQEAVENADPPAPLWDPTGNVEGGIQHAGDGARSGS